MPSRATPASRRTRACRDPLNVNAAVAGLTPGVYNIVVWARSTATNSFDNVAVVRVRIA
jgi:hypothetical protein